MPGPVRPCRRTAGVATVLEQQALFFISSIDIGDRLFIFLDAPDVLVEPVVLVEELGKMVIAGLHLVYGVLELGKLVMQVVLLQFHDAFLD
jgi:hypothetical protein